MVPDRLRKRQRGISGAFVIVAFVVVGLAILFAMRLSGTQVSAGQDAANDEKMRRVSAALVSYASANGRLPCPALGIDAQGNAAPNAATATCTAGAEVVPWRTLGLRRDDALDGWGRKIAYRVYTGATGLTQANGVNATDCSTTAGVPVAGVDSTLTAGYQCNALHNNTYAQFLAGKGFTVNDQGSNRTGVAYVLVSHGETGYGAYGAEANAATARQMPTAGGNEAANAGTTPPFFVRAHSAPGLAPSDANHFDDVVVYRTLDEVVKASKLVARAWPLPTPPPPPGTVGEAVFDRNALANAGITPQNNLGTNTITVNGIQVTAAGDTARNVSSGVGTSGEGLGAIQTGSSVSSETTISSATNEELTFRFPGPARSVGITLADFGTINGNFERVEFFFFLGATQVGGSVQKDACNAGNVQANYSIGASGDFDSLVVRPKGASGGNDSTLLVASIRACDATVAVSACVSPTRVAANDCP